MTRWSLTDKTSLAGPEFGIDSNGIDVIENGSITSTPGILASGVSSGIKSGDALDLALVDAGTPSTAAGVFTANKVRAAPLIISQGHLLDGEARAILANSGCANACTGKRGLADARSMAGAVASGIGCEPEEVLLASTGLIGYYLPIDKVVAAIPRAVEGLSTESGSVAARAIMTTDTAPKETGVLTEIDRKTVTVSGMAKGAAMLSPSMATMLGFITTDVDISRGLLHKALVGAVSKTFNQISVDACQSTNDTVFVLATGSAGNSKIREEGCAEFYQFETALSEVCAQLAIRMVFDGEGSTRVARVAVSGAGDDRDAQKVVRQICSSILVRCSLHGADPYWGRIASEIGASGAAQIEPEKLSITYGDLQVALDGVEVEHDRELLEAYMTRDYVDIKCDLGIGYGKAVMLTCDLGPGYIEENRGTS